MGELSTHDYERMLDLAVALIENQSPEALWHLVGEELVTGLGATTAIFVELHHRWQTGRAEGWAPQWVGGTPLEDLVHRRMRQRHPVFVYAAHGELRPTTVEDIADRTRWRRSDCYNEAYEIYGTTRQMVLPLFASPDVIRGFILGRPGQNFNTRELAFARRVQPLLHAADRHLGALRHHGGSPEDAEPTARSRKAAAYGSLPGNSRYWVCWPTDSRPWRSPAACPSHPTRSTAIWRRSTASSTPATVSPPSCRPADSAWSGRAFDPWESCTRQRRPVTVSTPVGRSRSASGRRARTSAGRRALTACRHMAACTADASNECRPVAPRRRRPTRPCSSTTAGSPTWARTRSCASVARPIASSRDSGGLPAVILSRDHGGGGSECTGAVMKSGTNWPRPGWSS